MKSVWVGTDWHVWSIGHTPHHPYQSVSNIRQLSDSYANDIQVDDVFIYLGDLCDPAVTDLNELKRLVQNIPGYKILVKGNHDTETDYFYRDIGFDEVCDVCVINQVAFSHFPLKVEPDMINIQRSDVDDANHINAYREDYYKHPIEISELIQNAYDKWLKDRAVHKVSEIADAKTGKAYDASRILYLTDIFEEDMLKPVDEAFVGNDEVSTTYLMSLSTVDTEEKLLKWIRQNLHVGPMGKVKTDIEMARSRSASDFDIALFVNPRLRKLGHNPRLMVFIGYEPNNPKPGFVHMFNYWVDLDDSVTWFEASWRGNEGIHEFEDIDDMKTEILSLYRDRIESNKYTETIFHSVNHSYLKPGRDPQEILKDIFGEDGLVNESAAKSEIDKDFIPKEKIKLSSLKKIRITEELINKYKKDYPVLRHVRCKDTKEYICDGYMWMNHDDKLVCYVGSCEYTDDHTKWIVSLEIIPEFKGHGLSKQILDFATKTMNCKYLSVNKDNKLAKSIYDKYGFKVYTTDDNMYYMTIDPKAKINESFAICGLHNSIIKVDDQDYGDAGLVSCIDWFCDMVQLGSQLIYIKTTNRIRNLWAITEQNSSPLGGRGVDYSYVINLDMIPKNIDKFSLMKFICLFDILVTTSDQRTIEAGCPNALCAAIAYWYSQPYYDQLFELPEEYMHPSKEVQNWFNMIQCYQRTVNDTAVDLLVRDLFWNKEVDPKILISSTLKNSMIACDVNNESAMSQYECLLSLNEATYDLSKYTDLIVPGTMQSSPFSGKKITSFVDDLLDANIKITPETIDKIALKQVKSAQDLVDYYNSRLESFTDYSSGSYLGSADVLWTLLFNMNNFSINNWEKFIPTKLSEVEFAQYMDKRFAELDEIEKMYQDIMINNIGAMRLSEVIIDAKSELDAKDSKFCKVSTKKDGTVVYDYGKDLGKVFIGSDVYNDDNDKFKTTIKPSRFFTRVHEYDYIIVTHGKIDGNPNLWEIEHITIDKNACYMVSELLDDIGTDKKVLLLICNPKGRQISGKYKNVTYSTNYVLDESAIPSNINIHDTIQTKISIIKTKIKQLQKINKRINIEAVKSTSDVEFGFIVIRNTNKKNLYPYLEYIKENVDFRHKYTHFIINDYIYALESAKTIFKWMNKVYFNSMPETGYYWTYQHNHCPIIMTIYDNPVIGGAVFSTIDECISDARDYLDDIYGSGEYTISIYKAIKGHPLPGQRIRIDESTFIDSHDVRECMTITIPEETNNLNEILMEPEDAHLFLADDEAGEKSQKPYKIKLSTDDQGVIAEATYDLEKYRKKYQFDSGKYAKEFINDKKLTSLIDDLLDANIKISPQTIDRVALLQVKNAEDLVKYFTTRIDKLTISDDYIASGFIMATLLDTDSLTLDKFKDFVPIGLTEDQFAEYMKKRISEFNLIESMYRAILINRIGNYSLGINLTTSDYQFVNNQFDKPNSDLVHIDENYSNDTVLYDYGDGFAKVYIEKNIYNAFKTGALKPSRLYTRASKFDYIIITHGVSNPSSDEWKIFNITINGKKFKDAKSLIKYLGKDKAVLFLVCNPDGKVIENYPKLVQGYTNIIFENGAYYKANVYDMINDILKEIHKHRKALKYIYRMVINWVKNLKITEYPNYNYPIVYIDNYHVLRMTSNKFNNISEFISEGNQIITFINNYRDMLDRAKYIFEMILKVYYNMIAENGYYWATTNTNDKVLIPGFRHINPIVAGMVYKSLDECLTDAREFYDTHEELIESWGNITIFKSKLGYDTPGYTKRSEDHMVISFDQLSDYLGNMNEDAYQLQGIDRDQQDVISKKYGIRAVGHETEEEIKYREEREKAERERKAEFKKKQKEKQLAKARKAKKKIAKKRELEKKKEEFKSKFNKKNEEVDISDIPYNDGSRNFFDNTPGVANADFVNETGYKFEMLDKVKFFDPINESVDDRTLYPVYVLCVHTGTLLANAIKKATGSHFSHCTISFDSSLKNMYSFGRKTRLTELSNGSFVKESIHNPPYTNKGVTYALYCIPVTSSQLAAMKKRLEYFVKNKTKFRYDFAGLFKNFFGIADNPEQRWFCSRFVADIINAGTEPGQKPMIREPSLMRPEDFLYTNFALYVTSGLIKDYDQILVDKVTKKLLRIESIRRTQQRAVQSTNIPVTESAVLDLNPYDPLGEAIFNYQMATMDESAYQNFKKYLHSFKIKLDKDGNIIIHRREVDQLDKYFREANQLLKVNMKAGNEQGVVDQLCRVHYMINLINKYYLISTTKQNTTVKADLKKQLIDLRSVMINVYQQYLSWVTARNPQFNFQTAYDASIYSDKITVPKEVITSIGRVIMTML